MNAASPDRRPAVLGGPPAFPDGLRLLRPTLPSFESVGPRWERCFASGTLTKGEALAEYEHRVAEHLGVRHALGVSSCTLGLTLVLDQYRGRHALLPSFTFMATAMAATWAGLQPVFCDVDPETWCLDPHQVEETLDREGISAEDGVVLPVHVFGTPADTDAFADLGRRRGVPVVYDAAHGFGTRRDGRPLGGHGAAEVFSTSPTKLLITGEGGIVATDDDRVAEHVAVGREYGNPGSYDALFVGLNARLPEASALLGLASLEILEGEATRRNHLATVYRSELGDVPGICFQHVRAQDRCSYKDLSLTVGPDFRLSRDELVATLAAEGIPSRRYYVPPAHRLTAFAGAPADLESRLPVTARLAERIVSLPLYGRLSEDDVRTVAFCVRAAHRHADAVQAALPSHPHG